MLVYNGSFCFPNKFLLKVILFAIDLFDFIGAARRNKFFSLDLVLLLGYFPYRKGI